MRANQKRSNFEKDRISKKIEVWKRSNFEKDRISKKIEFRKRSKFEKDRILKRSNFVKSLVAFWRQNKETYKKRWKLIKRWRRQLQEGG